MSGGRRILLIPLAALLAVTLVVAGCGRRGAPEPPGMARPAGPMPEAPHEPGPETAPDRPFLLDPLL